MIESQILKVLTDAGAPPVDAAAATELLRQGRSVREVLEVVTFAPVELKPEVVEATFAAQLLVARAGEVARALKVEIEAERS